MKARQQAGPPREDSQRKVLFFFFYLFFFLLVLVHFFSFVFLGGCGCVHFFFGGGGGWGVLGSGTPWVVAYATSGLLPDNTDSQWEMSNFGGGGGVISLHRCQF